MATKTYTVSVNTDFLESFEDQLGQYNLNIMWIENYTNGHTDCEIDINTEDDILLIDELAKEINLIY